MNDLARDALVRASLNGTRQIKGIFRDGEGGYCALGVLLASVEGLETGDYIDEMYERFGMSEQEATDIIEANDKMDWDFLTIARKIGAHDDMA